MNRVAKICEAMQAAESKVISPGTRPKTSLGESKVNSLGKASRTGMFLGRSTQEVDV